MECGVCGLGSLVIRWILSCWKNTGTRRTSREFMGDALGKRTSLRVGMAFLDLYRGGSKWIFEFRDGGTGQGCANKGMEAVTKPCLNSIS